MTDTQTRSWSFETEPTDPVAGAEDPGGEVDLHVGDDPIQDEGADQPDPAPRRPARVVVRRRSLLFLVLAAAYAVMAALFLTRAITDGSTLDWILAAALVVGTLGLWLFFFDSREDLLVADDRGIRLRLGGTWRGMFWVDLEKVTVLDRHGLRDGRLLLEPIDLDEHEGLLGRAERLHARANTAMYGAPFAMPLTLTTRVLGAGDDLATALTGLSDERCPVVRVDPYQAEPTDETDADELDGELDPDLDEDLDEESTGELAPIAGADEQDEREDDALDEPAALDDEDVEPETRAETELAALEVAPSPIPSPTPWPAREPTVAVRADLSRERPRPAAVDDPDATQPFDLHQVVASDATVVIDDVADVPVVVPVIGPVLATARRMLHLDVDQLAERTRIRPHVIEAIEIDDFAPCGGDFYARGHLRTLARVLGVEVAPLLATYDERYADAPVDPLRVFEADLAGGRHGPIRSTRGGPNWSVLVAAVMTVVLAWSVARLVMDNPTGDQSPSPSLAAGSAGLTSSETKASPIPVTLTAAGGGAHLVVRDGTGKVVFTGDLAFGQSKTLQVPPPVRVQTSDGSTRVAVQGRDEGALGKTGRPAEHVYTAP